MSEAAGMKTIDRRSFLQSSLGGIAGVAAVPLLGGLAGCQQTPARPAAAGGKAAEHTAARATALATEKLTERVTLITGAPGNLVALSSADGVVLVDSGSAE